jgi:hypothetical protein
MESLASPRTLSASTSRGTTEQVWRHVQTTSVATLWYFEALGGSLVLLFAIEDSASWLWTLLPWHAERQRM